MHKFLSLDVDCSHHHDARARTLTSLDVHHKAATCANVRTTTRERRLVCRVIDTHRLEVGLAFARARRTGYAAAARRVEGELSADGCGVVGCVCKELDM